jgi:hypothetical protein
MLTGYIAWNEHFIVCPNQDIAYGAGFFDLDKEPAVFQVPDFGDRFWVYALYDGRTDEFGGGDAVARQSPRQPASRLSPLLAEGVGER